MKYKNTPTNSLVCSYLLSPYSSDEPEMWEMAKLPQLEDISEKIVLDLGCGFGSNFISFLKENPQDPKILYHLDANLEVFYRKISEKEIQNFHNKENPVSWRKDCGRNRFYDWESTKDIRVVADATNLPFKERHLDIIHQDMMMADNPRLDTTKAFIEINRVLKVGGIFISRGISGDYIGKNENLQRIETGVPLAVYEKVKEASMI